MGHKRKLAGTLLIIAAVVIQTTILNDLSFKGVKFDVGLIIIILTSNYNGSITGQLTGFTAGIVEDFLSLSPLGFNAITKSFLGYLSGKTEGKIFLDPIVTPMVLVIVGSLLKYILSFILLLAFFPEKQASVFTYTFLIEIIMNALITPFIYLFLKIIRILPSQTNSRMP